MTQKTACIGSYRLLEFNSENTEDHWAVINLWNFMFYFGTLLARTAEQATQSVSCPLYLLEHQLSQACDLLSILWMVQDVFFDKECLSRIKSQSNIKWVKTRDFFFLSF